MIYETLFFYGTAKAGVVDRWLGTSYAWSNGGKTLTVQLRHGVKWTDGKPFTSADVAYTFNLALKNAALNKFALPLKSVTTSGLYIVALNFKQSAYTDAYLCPRPGRHPAPAHLAVGQEPDNVPALPSPCRPVASSGDIRDHVSPPPPLAD
jgi:ABC-type transport system substrate-binding protein